MSNSEYIWRELPFCGPKRALDESECLKFRAPDGMHMHGLLDWALQRYGSGRKIDPRCWLTEKHVTVEDTTRDVWISARLGTCIPIDAGSEWAIDRVLHPERNKPMPPR